MLIISVFITIIAVYSPDLYLGIMPTLQEYINTVGSVWCLNISMHHDDKAIKIHDRAWRVNEVKLTYRNNDSWTKSNNALDMFSCCVLITSEMENKLKKPSKSLFTKWEPHPLFNPLVPGMYHIVLHATHWVPASHTTWHPRWRTATGRAPAVTLRVWP